MKKIITVCIGNTILFILMGLAFLYPFSDIDQFINETGFSAQITIFPFLLIAYLIFFPIVYYVLSRKKQWGKNSELTYCDEREKTIVAKAAKTAYKIFIGGAIIMIVLLGGTKLFSIFTRIEISIYSVSIILLALLLVISTIAYCIKWCSEYKK